MNAEQKQALIERCERISEWREKYGDYANVMLPAVEAQQIAQIALAALTTPPIVKPYLPDDCDRTEAHYKYAAAIRAAGYQVEGE
ncbi:hypothetical protein [Pantoea agglomerans]|uniref:hypothetical protein n=1 Tax=Enterobacter agglomerans TaxID=549 RepID=UPI0024137E30|nr:hypothetical protein [Pantoea agglomerans]